MHLFTKEMCWYFRYKYGRASDRDCVAGEDWRWKGRFWSDTCKATIKQATSRSEFFFLAYLTNPLFFINIFQINLINSIASSVFSSVGVRILTRVCLLCLGFVLPSPFAAKFYPHLTCIYACIDVHVTRTFMIYTIFLFNKASSPSTKAPFVFRNNKLLAEIENLAGSVPYGYVRPRHASSNVPSKVRFSATINYHFAHISILQFFNYK